MGGETPADPGMRMGGESVITDPGMHGRGKSYRPWYEVEGGKSWRPHGMRMGGIDPGMRMGHMNENRREESC